MKAPTGAAFGPGTEVVPTQSACLMLVADAQ